MSRKCIFHIPNALDKNWASASQIRPKKMKEAFESIGYEVDTVWGTARERKQAIKKIERNIRKGVKYDFLYSESSTTPTLLTERHHLPTHPFLDFSFFSFVKKHGIKIGLFYRDMYWKFPIYRESVKGIKYQAAILMYKYDLHKYKQLLTKFYMPTAYCTKYVKRDIAVELVDYLPPACEKHKNFISPAKESSRLNLLYIGGLGNQYKIHKVFEAVNEMKTIYLTVCCREAEWKAVQPEYQAFMGNNIKIVHKKGKELEDLYKAADICLSFFETDAYREMAMPFKIFEYLSYGKPIISSSGTAAGLFVKKNGIGWTIDYTKEALVELLSYLCEHPEKIKKRQELCIEKIQENTWEKRAEKVARDLKYYGKG